jgi:diaminopimelate decarboxylase
MNSVTSKLNFFKVSSPGELVEAFGSPLYVYNEAILRQKCRDMKTLVKYRNFSVSYSAKANNNLHLLRIVREEGLNVDAMSAGEIFILLMAGFEPSQIFFIPNNVSSEELQYAIENNITTSLDSLSQLDRYGRLNPGGQVALRFNPGIGAGHSEKVITGGKNTKFGIDAWQIEEVKAILTKHELKLVGINQHIGSLFMTIDAYVESVKNLLSIAGNFPELEFIDMGGGFGVPYNKTHGEQPLDLKALGHSLDVLITEWAYRHNSKMEFRIEPGRYICAECSVLLGTVHAIKTNHNKKYIGTDIGFNAFLRPVLYESHHDIELYKDSTFTDAASSDTANLETALSEATSEKVTIVGNICESGDILAKDVTLPKIHEGDHIGVLDAGAYGYVMSSNFNNRFRPAELLITESDELRLIRRRDSFEDLLRNYQL